VEAGLEVGSALTADSPPLVASSLELVLGRSVAFVWLAEIQVKLPFEHADKDRAITSEQTNFEKFSRLIVCPLFIKRTAVISQIRESHDVKVQGET
jgi:hypothetical protein